MIELFFYDFSISILGMLLVNIISSYKYKDDKLIQATNHNKVIWSHSKMMKTKASKNINGKMICQFTRFNNLIGKYLGFFKEYMVIC